MKKSKFIGDIDLKHIKENQINQERLMEIQSIANADLLLSNDDVKTSTVIFNDQKIFAVDHNFVNGEGIKEHAEQRAIAQVPDINMVKDDIYIYTDLEPCVDCLRKILDISSLKGIYFKNLHKDKWNTDEYIKLREKTSLLQVEGGVILEELK